MEGYGRSTSSRIVENGVEEIAQMCAGHATPSSRPLSSLKELLKNKTPNCSVYELIRCHTSCWKALPEEVKSGRNHKFENLIGETAKQVKSTYTSLLQLLPE